MSLSSILPLIVLFLVPVLARIPSLPALEILDNNTPGSQFPISVAPVLDDYIPVPVLLGVMSRCPDALLCESVFDGVLKHTWDIVSINLSFLGKINASDLDYGVSCLHGPTECRGNIHELCAMRVAENSPQDWWQFVQCLNFEGKEDVGDPVLAERCAGLAYLPWEDERGKDGGVVRGGIKRCAEGREGRELLKVSVMRSERLGIEKSCTIMISGRTRCIHDGTWKECETGHTVDGLVSYIRAEYRRLNTRETTTQALEDE